MKLFIHNHFCQVYVFRLLFSAHLALCHCHLWRTFQLAAVLMPFRGMQDMQNVCLYRRMFTLSKFRAFLPSFVILNLEKLWCNFLVSLFWGIAHKNINTEIILCSVYQVLVCNLIARWLIVWRMYILELNILAAAISPFPPPFISLVNALLLYVWDVVYTVLRKHFSRYWTLVSASLIKYGV